jgi:transposase, IS5 family
VLKHLRDWSYDQIEREVAGSLVYRRFCRIDAGKVPDAKTMVRLGQIVDGPALRELLQRLVAMAAEVGVTKGNRLRVDTTVLEAPIHYPTDSGMCEDAIRVLSRIMRRMLDAGVELGFKLRNVRRSVSRRMREIAQGLRRRGDRAKRAIRRPYRRLLRITGRIVRQAERAAARAREHASRLRGKVRRRVVNLAHQLGMIVPRARQVLRQTRARIVDAQTRAPGKIVSIFEPWAKPIRKGKLDRPTEFGVLVKVQEAEGGIVRTSRSTMRAQTRRCWYPRSNVIRSCSVGHPGSWRPTAVSTPAVANVGSSIWACVIRSYPSRAIGPGSG